MKSYTKQQFQQRSNNETWECFISLSGKSYYVANLGFSLFKCSICLSNSKFCNVKLMGDVRFSFDVSWKQVWLQ